MHVRLLCVEMVLPRAELRNVMMAMRVILMHVQHRVRPQYVETDMFSQELKNVTMDE